MVLLSWTVVIFVVSLSQITHAHIFSRQLPVFLNWPTGSPGDTKKDALTQAFKDIVNVVNQVLNSDTATYNAIFDKYFLPEHQDAVKAVFQNMAAPATDDPSTGADISSTIDIHPEDYLPTMIKQCSGLNSNKRPLAYTDNPIDEPQTRIHFCDTTALNAYAYPKLDDINCGTIDLFVSYKMLSLGGYILLHEVTHVNKVSQAAIMPFKQKGNVVGGYQYGHWYTRQLRSTMETSPLVIANADNYAWFANEVYWSHQCGHGFATPRDNILAPPGACNVSGRKRDGPAEGDCLGH